MSSKGGDSPSSERLHEVEAVDFDNGFLILTVDGQVYKDDLNSLSGALAKADEDVRRHFVVSPSGSGIHWPDLDEDLSVDGIIRLGTLISD